MLLKLHNIGKIYNSNDILTIGIRGVNLEFDYNEFVTIEGESGSGKSTLLNVIGANDSYEEGELYINDVGTSHYSETEWEKYREQNIATIFQDFNIIENLTVVENVELALLRIDDRKERRRIAKELIEKVGLTKQANQRGSKLSGGEKQRTVIARALAKDSPIILADEPTGNLDVKASREVAKLLKDVSKDKLVIVVTHNPEFFVDYATRRVKIFDGAVSEDNIIEKPDTQDPIEIKEIRTSKKRNFINTLHIGWLNYKSRPKFTSMMSIALFVCAIMQFMILSIFGNSLIQPITKTLDNVGVEGKIILSAEDTITAEQLDEIAGLTKAGYYLLDRELSEFTVVVPKAGTMNQSYEITCIYAPYGYPLKKGEAVLVIPVSLSQDEQAIKDAFLNAQVGIENITTDKTLKANETLLYLGYDALTEYGVKMQAINTTMMIGSDEATVYTFEIGDVDSGSVNLINSNYYSASGKIAVFNAKANKSYIIADTSEKREEVNGLIVQMNEQDYIDMFETSDAVNQSCLFYSSDKEANSAISKLGSGYMGMLSTSEIYIRSVGDVFAMNVVYYLALIAISLFCAACIFVIFGRSVKIFITDFAVYRTLGISGKVSSRSLYVQMLLIFLPTLVLLPIISLIATVLPFSTIPLISIGNYLFVEIMLLLIVEFVAFGFNKNIKGQSIRKSLRRGSK